MKKLLFVLFAALAFVACEKEENRDTTQQDNPKKVEEELPLLNSSPRFKCSPDYIVSPSEGLTFAIQTSSIPIIHNKTYVGNMNNIETQILECENELTSQPYTVDRELYSIKQINECTYQIEIKPFNENRDIMFDFICPLYTDDNPGCRAIVHCQISE